MTPLFSGHCVFHIKVMMTKRHYCLTHKAKARCHCSQTSGNREKNAGFADKFLSLEISVHFLKVKQRFPVLVGNLNRTFYRIFSFQPGLLAKIELGLLAWSTHNVCWITALSPIS